LFATACTDRAATGGMAAVVRDSAGIEIVEHSAELIAALPVWTVQGEPIVDIGGGEDPNEQFVMVNAAVRLSDGRVVVTDSRNRDMRLFDAQGRYVQTLARAGQGPGELASAGAILRGSGDTLLVTDQLRRTAVFAPDGRWITQIGHPQPGAGQGTVRILAARDDGRFLATSQPLAGSSEPASGSVVRAPYQVVVLDSAGAKMDTLAVVPGQQLTPTLMEEGGPPFLHDSPLHFGSSTMLAVSRRRLAVATNETNEIRLYELDALRRVIRDATPPRPVTAEIRGVFTAEGLAALTTPEIPEPVQAMLKRNFERTRFADHFPFYAGLMLGTDGSVWAQRMGVSTTDPMEFQVFGPDGKAVARVILPERVRPTEVSLSEVVGVWLDADDVPHVRVWRIGPAPNPES